MQRGGGGENDKYRSFQLCFKSNMDKKTYNRQLQNGKITFSNMLTWKN